MYTMASYAHATDASDRQSLRGDIVNTAVTRAQSLAFITCDSHAVKRFSGLDQGTRKLINQSPVIPANVLLDLLAVPCDVDYLNVLLDTAYQSDKKKRNHPSTAQRKQNKRANLGEYPR